MLQASSRLSSVAADGGSAMTAGAVAPSGSAPSARLETRRLTSAPAQALTARSAERPGTARRPSDNLQTAPSISVRALARTISSGQRPDAPAGCRTRRLSLFLPDPALPAGTPLMRHRRVRGGPGFGVGPGAMCREAAKCSGSVLWFRQQQG